MKCAVWEVYMSRFVVLIVLLAMLSACAPAGVSVTMPAPSAKPTNTVTISPTNAVTTSPTDAVTTSPTDTVTTSPDDGTDSTQPGSPNSYQPQEGDAQLKRGNVFIDTAQILVLESYPPQFRLSIAGSLPTPCHKLRMVVGHPDANNRINVEAYSVYDPEAVCIQVLKAFEAVLSLDGFAAGKYNVWLNGKAVGEIEVPAPLDGTSMKGWELYSWSVDGVWSYSLLVGTNRNKTLDEVQDPITRLADVAALKKQLARLAKGELVFWVMRDIAGLSLPPEEVIYDIRAFCAQQELELTLP